MKTQLFLSIALLLSAFAEAAAVPQRIDVTDFRPKGGECVLDALENLRVKVGKAKASGSVTLVAAPGSDDVSVALNRGAVFQVRGAVKGEGFASIAAIESTERGEDMTESFPWRWMLEGPYFGYMGTGIPQVPGGLLKVNRDKIRANAGATVDLVMLGDSISHFWPVNGPVSWKSFNEGRNVFDFGGGSDRVQDTLYVARWGYLDGYVARNVSVMVGVNNIRDKTSAAGIAKGIGELIGIVKVKQPKARILLHAILPFSAPESEVRKRVAEVNALLKPLADGKRVVWIDLTPKFVNANGTFKKGMIKGDLIHPAEAGYAAWAECLKNNL